jgi:glycosyltransferase involved in cell wall biosynthesis
MMEPKISVVIASGAGGEFLPNCLASLRAQAEAENAEVIVVDRCGEAAMAHIREEFPFARLIRPDLDHRPSVPELRGIGVRAASGDLIAIIEEHCIAAPDWLSTIKAQFHDGDAVIGGPILDDHYSRMMDWTVYLSEYHNYLPPWEEGERLMLNGVNIAYERQKLLSCAEVFNSGYWETALHPLLLQKGKFRSIPQMVVKHTGPFAFKYYMTQRYLLSRVWGGSQKDTVSASKRILYLVIGPLIPFILTLRIGLRAWRSRQYFGKYLAALPLLIPVTCAYAWGEWQGYLSGKGDALERVE